MTVDQAKLTEFGRYMSFYNTQGTFAYDGLHIHRKTTASKSKITKVNLSESKKLFLLILQSTVTAIKEEVQLYGLYFEQVSINWRFEEWHSNHD